MGLSTSPAAPLWLLHLPTTLRWTARQSRGPDIDTDVKGPPDQAKIAGGAIKCVTDTRSSLAASSAPSAAVFITDTLSMNKDSSSMMTMMVDSPISSPSTSPSSASSLLSSSASSVYSSISKFSIYASSHSAHKINPKSSFAAPMLSPASSTDSLDNFFSTSFLERVYPNANMGRLAVPVQSNIDGWKLAVLDDVDTDSRTLYAQAVCGNEISSREGVIALLDFGDEELECDQVVVVLNKKDSDLAQQIHSLMYVGGNVIPPTKSKHSNDFVLVGLEL